MAKVTQAQVEALEANPTMAGIMDLLSGNAGCSGDMTGSTRCDNCFSCTYCKNCNGSASCNACVNVDNSKRCVRCEHLGTCFDCVNCKGQVGDKALRLFQCADCVDCTRCIGLTGGVGQRNVAFGIQRTQAQFGILWAVIEAANA
jgi:hypothetical protein